MSHPRSPQPTRRSHADNTLGHHGLVVSSALPRPASTSTHTQPMPGPQVPQIADQCPMRAILVEQLLQENRMLHERIALLERRNAGSAGAAGGSGPTPYNPPTAPAFPAIPSLQQSPTNESLMMRLLTASAAANAASAGLPPGDPAGSTTAAADAAIFKPVSTWTPFAAPIAQLLPLHEREHGGSNPIQQPPALTSHIPSTSNPPFNNNHINNISAAARNAVMAQMQNMLAGGTLAEIPNPLNCQLRESDPSFNTFYYTLFMRQAQAIQREMMAQQQQQQQPQTQQQRSAANRQSDLHSNSVGKSAPSVSLPGKRRELAPGPDGVYEPSPPSSPSMRKTGPSHSSTLMTVTSPFHLTGLTDHIPEEDGVADGPGDTPTDHDVGAPGSLAALERLIDPVLDPAMVLPLQQETLTINTQRYHLVQQSLRNKTLVYSVDLYVTPQLKHHLIQLTYNAIYSLCPNRKSEHYRHSIRSYVKQLIRRTLGSQVYFYGDSILRTYTPIDPIRLSVFVSKTHESNWLRRVVSTLCQETQCSVDFPEEDDVDEPGGGPSNNSSSGGNNQSQGKDSKRAGSRRNKQQQQQQQPDGGKAGLSASNKDKDALSDPDQQQQADGTSHAGQSSGTAAPGAKDSNNKDGHKEDKKFPIHLVTLKFPQQKNNIYYNNYSSSAYNTVCTSAACPITTQVQHSNCGVGACTTLPLPTTGTTAVVPAAAETYLGPSSGYQHIHRLNHCYPITPHPPANYHSSGSGGIKGSTAGASSTSPSSCSSSTTTTTNTNTSAFDPVIAATAPTSPTNRKEPQNPLFNPVTFNANTSPAQSTDSSPYLSMCINGTPVTICGNKVSALCMAALCETIDQHISNANSAENIAFQQPPKQHLLKYALILTNFWALGQRLLGFDEGDASTCVCSHIERCSHLEPYEVSPQQTQRRQNAVAAATATATAPTTAAPAPVAASPAAVGSLTVTATDHPKLTTPSAVPSPTSVITESLCAEGTMFEGLSEIHQFSTPPFIPDTNSSNPSAILMSSAVPTPGDQPPGATPVTQSAAATSTATAPTATPSTNTPNKVERNRQKHQVAPRRFCPCTLGLRALHGGLPPSAMRTVVLYILNAYQQQLFSPFDALIKCIELLAHFDFANWVFTMYGPVCKYCLFSGKIVPILNEKASWPTLASVTHPEVQCGPLSREEACEDTAGTAGEGKTVLPKRLIKTKRPIRPLVSADAIKPFIVAPKMYQLVTDLIQVQTDSKLHQHNLPDENHVGHCPYHHSKQAAAGIASKEASPTEPALSTAPAGSTPPPPSRPSPAHIDFRSLPPVAILDPCDPTVNICGSLDHESLTKIQAGARASYNSIIHVISTLYSQVLSPLPGHQSKYVLRGKKFNLFLKTQVSGHDSDSDSDDEFLYPPYSTSSGVTGKLPRSGTPVADRPLSPQAHLPQSASTGPGTGTGTALVPIPTSTPSLSVPPSHLTHGAESSIGMLSSHTTTNRTHRKQYTAQLHTTIVSAILAAIFPAGFVKHLLNTGLYSIVDSINTARAAAAPGTAYFQSYPLSTSLSRDSHTPQVINPFVAPHAVIQTAVLSPSSSRLPPPTEPPGNLPVTSGLAVSASGGTTAQSQASSGTSSYAQLLHQPNRFNSFQSVRHIVNDGVLTIISFESEGRVRIANNLYYYHAETNTLTPVLDTHVTEEDDCSYSDIGLLQNNPTAIATVGDIANHVQVDASGTVVPTRDGNPHQLLTDASMTSAERLVRMAAVEAMQGLHGSLDARRGGSQMTKTGPSDSMYGSVVSVGASAESQKSKSLQLLAQINPALSVSGDAVAETSSVESRPSIARSRLSHTSSHTSTTTVFTTSGIKVNITTPLIDVDGTLINPLAAQLQPHDDESPADAQQLAIQSAAAAAAAAASMRPGPRDGQQQHQHPTFTDMASMFGQDLTQMGTQSHPFAQDYFHLGFLASPPVGSQILSIPDPNPNNIPHQQYRQHQQHPGAQLQNYQQHPGREGQPPGSSGLMTPPHSEIPGGSTPLNLRADGVDGKLTGAAATTTKPILDENKTVAFMPGIGAIEVFTGQLTIGSRVTGRSKEGKLCGVRVEGFVYGMTRSGRAKVSHVWPPTNNTTYDNLLSVQHDKVYVDSADNVIQPPRDDGVMGVSSNLAQVANGTSGMHSAPTANSSPALGMMMTTTGGSTGNNTSSGTMLPNTTTLHHLNPPNQQSQQQHHPQLQLQQQQQQQQPQQPNHGQYFPTTHAFSTTQFDNPAFVAPIRNIPSPAQLQAIPPHTHVASPTNNRRAFVGANPFPTTTSDELDVILHGDLNDMCANLAQARQFTQANLSEERLVELIVHILQTRGPVPIGRMGSLLHETTNNHSLPATLKEQYGGLKRFIELMNDVFIVGKDHPYNPHVFLANQHYSGILTPTATPQSIAAANAVAALAALAAEGGDNSTTTLHQLLPSQGGSAESGSGPSGTAPTSGLAPTPTPSGTTSPPPPPPPMPIHGGNIPTHRPASTAPAGPNASAPGMISTQITTTSSSRSPDAATGSATGSASPLDKRQGGTDGYPDNKSQQQQQQQQHRHHGHDRDSHVQVAAASKRQASQPVQSPLQRGSMSHNPNHRGSSSNNISAAGPSPGAHKNNHSASPINTSNLHGGNAGFGQQQQHQQHLGAGHHHNQGHDLNHHQQQQQQQQHHHHHHHHQHHNTTGFTPLQQSQLSPNQHFYPTSHSQGAATASSAPNAANTVNSTPPSFVPFHSHGLPPTNQAHSFDSQNVPPVPFGSMPMFTGGQPNAQSFMTAGLTMDGTPPQYQPLQQQQQQQQQQQSGSQQQYQHQAHHQDRNRHRSQQPQQQQHPSQQHQQQQQQPTHNPSPSLFGLSALPSIPPAIPPLTHALPPFGSTTDSLGSPFVHQLGAPFDFPSPYPFLPFSHPDAPSLGSPLSDLSALSKLQQQQPHGTNHRQQPQSQQPQQQQQQQQHRAPLPVTGQYPYHHQPQQHQQQPQSGQQPNIQQSQQQQQQQQQQHQAQQMYMYSQPNTIFDPSIFQP